MLMLISKQVRNRLAMMLGDEYETEGDVVLMQNEDDKTYDVITSTGEQLGGGKFKAVKYLLGSNGFVYFCVTKTKELVQNRTPKKRIGLLFGNQTEVYYEIYNSDFVCTEVNRVKAAGYSREMGVQLGKKYVKLKMNYLHNGFHYIEK